MLRYMRVSVKYFSSIGLIIFNNIKRNPTDLYRWTKPWTKPSNKGLLTSWTNLERNCFIPLTPHSFEFGQEQTGLTDLYIWQLSVTSFSQYLCIKRETGASKWNFSASKYLQVSFWVCCLVRWCCHFGISRNRFLNAAYFKLQDYQI